MQGQNGNGFGHTAGSASERGEIAFHGHGGRRPRVLAHGGNGEKHLIVGNNDGPDTLTAPGWASVRLSPVRITCFLTITARPSRSR